MIVTKNEAMVVSCYTKILMVPIDDLHEYIEKVMHRSVCRHELAGPEVWCELKNIVRVEFMKICENVK